MNASWLGTFVLVGLGVFALVVIVWFMSTPTNAKHDDYGSWRPTK
jgi:hypothetical protein